MKANSKKLLDRSVSAMVAAIEIYNKPGFPYRNESFAILAINGWELLLKAKWLDMHGNKRQSLYVYDRHSTKSGSTSTKKSIKKTRSGTPFTHDLTYLVKQLENSKTLDHSASRNIEVMLEFRDCATHFYNESPDFNAHLYEIGAACVKNFVNAVREWFNRDVTEFDLHLMPLTFVSLPSNVEASLLNAEQNNFLAFLNGIDEPDTDPESPYSVRVNVELKFVKAKSKDAFPVQVTNDPSALQVALTEQDIRERYPWDYTELTNRCKARYEGFKVNKKYHELRKGLESDDRFGHQRFLDPGNSSSSKKTFFNPNILQEFDKHYTKNG